MDFEIVASTLKFQYPSIAGLQSSALAIQLDFKRHDRFFIQIINRSPNNQGTHWLVLSKPARWSEVYDSVFDDIPYLEEQVIANIVDIKDSELQMQWHTKTQNNQKYFVPYRTVPFRSGYY